MPTLSLSEVRQGTRARVVEVPAASPDANRLIEMGLTEGTEFTVIKVAPLGDPIEILLRGYRLCLRKRESQGFTVEVLER